MDEAVFVFWNDFQDKKTNSPNWILQFDVWTWPFSQFIIFQLPSLVTDQPTSEVPVVPSDSTLPGFDSEPRV
jgi:hypothetical protein